MKSILGQKQTMSQTFVGDTRVVTTAIKTSPCVVTHVKNEAKDGYWAVQLGLGEKRIKNVTKPMQGHLKQVIKDKKAPRFIKEIRVDEEPKMKKGDAVSASSVFKKGDIVSVVGTSKGKGFAGGVKRWGFAGGPRTHGQSDRLRAPGSIGQGTDPGRVWKGKKMAGRMGAEQVTVKNLTVVDILEDGTILLSGPVPGPKGTFLVINKIGEGKLSDLIEETPEAVVQEGDDEEESGSDKETKEGNEKQNDQETSNK